MPDDVLYLLTGRGIPSSSCTLECLLPESLLQLLDSRYSLLDLFCILFTFWEYEKQTEYAGCG